MASSTLWAVDPLDDAAAIIEAEWLRLQQDRASSADLSADTPSRRPTRARLRVATEQQPPSFPKPADRSGQPKRRRSAMPVWPTQRSPPSAE